MGGAEKGGRKGGGRAHSSQLVNRLAHHASPNTPCFSQHTAIVVNKERPLSHNFFLRFHSTPTFGRTGTFTSYSSSRALAPAFLLYTPFPRPPSLSISSFQTTYIVTALSLTKWLSSLTFTPSYQAGLVSPHSTPHSSQTLLLVLILSS